MTCKVIVIKYMSFSANLVDLYKEEPNKIKNFVWLFFVLKSIKVYSSTSL